MQDCECVTATYAVTGVDRKVELGQLGQRRDDVLLVGAVEQQRLDATRADEQAMCCRHDPTHSGIHAFTRQASDLVPGNPRERVLLRERDAVHVRHAAVLERERRVGIGVVEPPGVRYAVEHRTRDGGHGSHAHVPNHFAPWRNRIPWLLRRLLLAARWLAVGGRGRRGGGGGGPRRHGVGATLGGVLVVGRGASSGHVAVRRVHVRGRAGQRANECSNE